MCVCSVCVASEQSGRYQKPCFPPAAASDEWLCDANARCAMQTFPPRAAPFNGSIAPQNFPYIKNKKNIRVPKVNALKAGVKIDIYVINAMVQCVYAIRWSPGNSRCTFLHSRTRTRLNRLTYVTICHVFNKWVRARTPPPPPHQHFFKLSPKTEVRGQMLLQPPPPPNTHTYMCIYTPCTPPPTRFPFSA